MSQAETREILEICRQIMDILNNTTVATAKIEQQAPALEKNLGSWRELERVALRYMAIAMRLELPEDMAAATEALSRLVIMIRMAQMSMNMLMKGTPVGILMGVAGLILTGMSAADSVRGGS